jgi:hypothetical protein
MGLFKFFNKKPKFVDDTFGELGYTTFKDATKNFYDGEVVFQEQKIGVVIDSDEQGPTKKQKEFFKKLDYEYHNIKNDIIIPFLKKESENNISNSGIDNFDDEFELDSIVIGRYEYELTEWTITYNSNSLKHYLSVCFKGMKPEYLTIDG